MRRHIYLALRTKAWPENRMQTSDKHSLKTNLWWHFDSCLFPFSVLFFLLHGTDCLDLSVACLKCVCVIAPLLVHSTTFTEVVCYANKQRRNAHVRWESAFPDFSDLHARNRNKTTASNCIRCLFYCKQNECTEARVCQAHVYTHAQWQNLPEMIIWWLFLLVFILRFFFDFGCLCSISKNDINNKKVQ